ncbi:phosphoribosylformylglycinamidine synthase II [Pajaroellobacter abortibovis]|uniref:Phosphoribosylformylglycinamidine synthase subunit PurL n=1 Tax=Pajaroellobacter abortibovis TaxID=1882918 RepID=A0A1L6MZX1_9BACT|nr:phosphoribosylformylglycinamidine synthase II [Pajaroellobacter abortibovis]
MTPTLLRHYKLSEQEYSRIQELLGRDPTYTELGVFSAMWSEHCAYKSSRVHLRKLPTQGARVLQGPGENAGIVDIGDGFAVVFKIESHNHPSFIEPYQGAATGVGGILRDIWTMGARPFALLNSLRFGSLEHPQTRHFLTEVVSGIGGYGNCIGIPTVGGEVQFDAQYEKNILVNAFACGIIRSDRIFYGRANGVGNPILHVGAKTGRDGIHGAIMASDRFSKDSQNHRTTVQVGDPFLGKLLLEACLELFEAELLEGIQDMGAAGLISSSVEMAERAGTGIELDLDQIPRRAAQMAPYELLLSESQERMLLVTKPGCVEQVIAICHRWGLDAAVIGQVTDTKRWVVKATPGFDPLSDSKSSIPPSIVCDLPIDVLTTKAPVYHRPYVPSVPPISIDHQMLSIPTDWEKEFLDMCGSPNGCSRQWIWQQYDHIVGGGTILRPGSSAAVMRVICCTQNGEKIDKWIAFSVDGNGRHCALSPRQGARMAVAEACRNLVCSGAEPIGITNGLNFGNPEQPEVMGQFVETIEGMREACEVLSIPIVSGNVSFYNDTDGCPIPPTPIIGAVGQLRSSEDCVNTWFKEPGDVIVLLGTPPQEYRGKGPRGLDGSEYLARKGERSLNIPPTIDLALEARLQRLILELARAGLLHSAQDLSEGGLALALAECCTSAPVYQQDYGARIDLDAPATPIELISLLFGEEPSRILVSIPPNHLKRVLTSAHAAGIPTTELGVVGGSSLSIVLVEPHSHSLPLIHLPLSSIRHTREASLPPPP